ncbi:MAG: DUF192 domain-containing protein [Xanthomonadales bacterium]|nr:DUF192 domain-containing protein [Xanthomonadales bacterium]
MNRWLAPLLLMLATSVHATATDATAPSVQLRGHTFSIELATTDAARQHGLMERTNLPADHGMLFVFASSAPQAFWMKNTLIPLDILYFDDARKLVSMQLDVPPCKADPCPIYPSHASARYVLELAAGTSRSIGAKPGDELTINGAVGTVQ